MTEELQKRLNSTSIRGLAKYIGMSEVSVRKWIRVGNIPNRHKRGIIEYFEMINDDNIEFCDKLLESMKK